MNRVPNYEKTSNKTAGAQKEVILTALPPGLIDGLPIDDQRAISEVVGKPVMLNEYDEYGRAELEFTDQDHVIHFIYVDPKFIDVW